MARWICAAQGVLVCTNSGLRTTPEPRPNPGKEEQNAELREMHAMYQQLLQAKGAEYDQAQQLLQAKEVSLMGMSNRLAALEVRQIPFRLPLRP